MRFDQVFKNIYVVNLDEHKNRWNKAQEEMLAVGIRNANRFSAIKPNRGKKLTDRIQGCKQSHLALIKMAREQQLEDIVIFEDDIEFNPEFKQYDFFQAFKAHYEWDLFYVGGNHTESKDYRIVGPNLIQTFRTLTTHAYIIHSRVYDRLIEILENSSYGTAVDSLYVKEIQKWGNSYGARPCLVYQRPGRSYIRQAFRNYQVIKHKL